MAILVATDSSGNGREPSGTDTGITIGQPSQADAGLCWSWLSTSSPEMVDPSAAWADVVSVTVVAVVKGGASNMIVEHKRPDAGVEGYQFGILSGDVRLNIKRDSPSQTDSFGSPMPVDTNWHMIGGVYSAPLAKGHIYIDGVQTVNANTFGTGLNYLTTLPLYIGRQTSGPGAGVSFNVLLDEVAVFDYAVAAARHAAYSAALAAGTGLAAEILADGPIAYWRFEDSAYGWQVGSVAF